MRIFLVGMCDIFLLLYLTSISGVDAPGVSHLTVDDYVELQTSSDTLKKKSEEIARNLESQERKAREAEEKAKELQARLETINRDRQAIEARASGLESENAKLKAADSRAQTLAEDLERARAQLEEEKRAAALRIRQIEDEKNAAARRVEEEQRIAAATIEEERRRAAAALKEEQRAAAARLEAEAKSRQAAEHQAAAVSAQVQQVSASLDEARKLADQQKKSAEEAAAAARLAREEAEKARQEALAARAAEEEAKKRAGEALSVAQNARQAEQEALAHAISAKVIALESQADAESASKEARQSQAEARKASAKLQSVTQSTTAAFEDKVRGRIIPLRVEVESKGLFGTSKESLEFSAVPVRFSSKRVVFVPKDQMDLSKDVISVKSSLGEQRAGTVLLNDAERSLVGFVFEGPGAAAAVLPREGTLEELYMPTLIAVRNGSPLGFSDRLRRVGRNYFPFERDRLYRENLRTLRFKAEGFRGTGDFAQYLVAGDQVVDLEGNLVGIVTENNRVHQIKLDEWREVPIRDIEPARDRG